MTKAPDTYELYAVSAPGVEVFTRQELVGLGLVPSLAGSASDDSAPQGVEGDLKGGVAFRGSLRDLYRANLHLRTASRVLVRLGSFCAATFPELRRKASRLPWEAYIAPQKGVVLRVTCHKSRLYHARAVAERMRGALSDRLGWTQPEADSAGGRGASQLVLVRLVRNLCTVSLDCSGDLLHRRGYRPMAVKAPLRETLAAAMLLASGWNRTSPLVDPFCGSGTIPIEAALLAEGRPPGLGRRFAFMDWPDFDEGLWRDLLAEADCAAAATFPRILASDRDAGAIRAALANAELAGVGRRIEFACRAISDLAPPDGTGWIVTNPPYGIRLKGAKDLRNLYARFGQVLRAGFQGWHVALLSPDVKGFGSTGLSLEKKVSLINGGMKVWLMTGVVENPRARSLRPCVNDDGAADHVVNGLPFRVKPHWKVPEHAKKDRDK